MRLLRLAVLAVCCATLIPSAGAAQSAATPSVAAPRSGAPLASQAAVGVRRAALAPAPIGAPAPFRGNTKQNRAMMIVGAAALLTGAVIGGDAGSLIMVGGAVVGLWGLYQYMQ